MAARWSSAGLTAARLPYRACGDTPLASGYAADWRGYATGQAVCENLVLAGAELVARWER